MAVSDIVGSLVEAQFLETLRAEPRLAAITRPVNVPAGANSTTVPIPDSSVTINDYVAGTAMTSERDVPTHVTLTINQQKYADVYVDDTEEFQTLPNLIGDVGRRGGEKMADTIGDYLATTISTSFPDANRTLGGSVEISGANDWNAAKRQTLVDAINAGAAAFKKAGAGRFQDRMVFATSPDIEEQLINYLVADKSSFGTGQYSDAAFASRALPRIFGADPLVDNDIAYSETAGAQIFGYFLINGVSLGFGQQLQQTRLVRPSNMFGTEFQALYTYGAARMSNSLFRAVALTVT